MHYDPVKKFLGSIFNRSIFLRKIFYHLLDLHLLRTWHIHKLIRHWSRVAPLNPVILDAGCGFGQYLYYFVRKFPGATITGVDIDHTLIEGCRAFFRKTSTPNVSLEVADLSEFSRSTAFDLILAVDVLEHIENDQKVLDNFFRSLKKNGMLIISTPSNQKESKANHPAADNVNAVSSPALYSFIGEHVRDGYSTDEIIGKLRTSGFNEIQVSYTYGWPGKLSWKLGMKFPMMLLGRCRWFIILLPVYFLLTYWLLLILNFMDLQLKHSEGTGLLVKAVK